MQQNIQLQHILPCFEGMIPSTIATCATDGTPNITYLSAVSYVDQSHIALSFQFFNKSRANVLENPRAQVLVVDPQSMRQYILEVQYLRTETLGEIFNKMKNTLDNIAEMTGMTGIFKLRGADVYKVLQCQASPTEEPEEVQKYQIGHLDALASLSQKMANCQSLDQLFPVCLKGMAQLFNYDHGMILIPSETPDQLFTVASHGYHDSGVGSEVTAGEGVLGLVAQKKRLVRITHSSRDQRFANAVRNTPEVELAPAANAVNKDIPLPEMVNVQSQLVIPLISRDVLLGVISMQSELPGRFVIEDEYVGRVLANHLATCMALLSSEDEESSNLSTTTSPKTIVDNSSARIKYYREDKSLFIDDEYIIKGLPGQILWKLLKTYTAEGRSDFSNREIRLDRSLNLPPVKDNLETRLILLRQRLLERCRFMQIEKTGRGQFRLQITKKLLLSEH